MQVRTCNHCCSGKATSITYSELLFAASGIQYAVPMSRIILPSTACPTLKHFSALSQNGSIFEKKNCEYKIVFWLPLQLSCETFLILRRIKWDRSKMYIGIYVKYPLFSSDFNETCIFSTDFRKILKYQILWKSLQWESNCSVRTDRRTENNDEANSRFSQFCKRS